MTSPAATSRQSPTMPDRASVFRSKVAAHFGRILTGALVVLLVYLALTPLPPFASDVFGSLTRRYVIVGLVLLGYLVLLLVQRRLPRRSIFDLPLAAVTFTVLLGVLGSADRRVSLEAVLPLLPSLVLFYIVHDSRSLTARALMWAVVVAASVIAVVALASVWRAWGEWWTLVRAVEGSLSRATLLPPSTPRVAGVGNHPNVLATLFAMTFPPALVLWTCTRDRRLRTLLPAVALLAVVALFFTLSRAAWLAALAGVATTGTCLLLADRRVRIPQGVWLVIGLGVLLLVMVSLWLLLSDARPEWLFRDSLSPRADMRRAGWAMFRANPLTGVGPGLFVALYPLFGGAEPFAAVHAHNIIVQTAVDTGLVGLLAGMVLAAVAAGAVVASLADGAVESRRGVAAGAGMLAAMLVHALADSPQLFPEVQAFAVVALVLIARGVETPDGEVTLPPVVRGVAPGIRDVLRACGWAGPVLAVMLAALLPVVWLVTSRAHQPYSESLARARDNRWPEAVHAAQRAVDRDDRLAANWFQLGAAHAFAAIDGDRRAEQQAALDAFRRGLELEPHNGAALVNFAALNVALGRPEVARAMLPALGQQAGRDSLLLLAHATLTQWTEQPQQAIETFSGLLVLNPTLGATPFWRDGEFRQANYDRIVDRALERVPEVAGDGQTAAALRAAITLYAGRATLSVSDVRSALAERPDDPSVMVAAGRLLLQSDEASDEAGTLLREAVRLRSDDALARVALGDWYARAGDTPRARREWLAGSYLGRTAATVALGASFPPGEVPAALRARAERQLQATEIARFYLLFQSYRFLFQRAEQNPLILPGDWLTALPAEYEGWRAEVERWR